MTRSLPLKALLVTLLFLGNGAPSAAAAPSCLKSCKEQTAACVREDCTGVRGEVRRACKRRCRARTGCGGAKIRTLAYVVTECRTDTEGTLSGTQTLRIRRRDCDPVTIGVCTGGSNQGMACSQPADCPDGTCGGVFTGPEPDPFDGCRLFGELRVGFVSYAGGVYQRLAVSPDGSTVIFEVSTDHPVRAAALPPGFKLEEGFFTVGSDGTGLRWLAPPSRDPPFRFSIDSGSPTNALFVYVSGVSFSPDGRTIVFSDIAPGPDGEDAPQIFTMDVASGQRTQLTSLPASPSVVAPFALYAGSARFVDSDTVAFFYAADLDGMHPNGTQMTVDTDGSDLRVLMNPIPLPGSSFDPEFVIAGGARNVVNRRFDGVPQGPHPLPTQFPFIQEVFVVDGTRSLQLTNFERDDTVGRFLDVRRRRVFFVASTDPLGKNPSQNCQLFSIDTLGRRLRQLTSFDETEPQSGALARNGCAGGPPPGCAVGRANQDPVTRTVVFESGCDPVGANPSGGQIFAIRPNGSRIRQVTHTRGMVTHADGSLEVELPGPWAYSAGRSAVVR